MSQNKRRKTSSIALVTLAIIMANLTSPGLTRADIFSGSSSSNNSNSIFGNFTNRISNIFQGRSVQLGGSVVPYEPNIPAPPGPNDPPLPDGGNFLKVWVEWETMYKNMTVPPGPEEQDPLQPIHEEYIKGNA
ncbi:hypothetical protein KC571_01730, partial [candidate division WWE3 bacterium]|nr:hypothetical protein [candidate division WWE3 bacterium]